MRNYTVQCPYPPPQVWNTTKSDVQLFDILADPCEHTNLAAEPSMQSVVTKMTKRLHEYAATAVTLTWCLNEGNEACTLPDGTMRDSDPSLFNGTWSPWCP